MPDSLAIPDEYGFVTAGREHRAKYGRTRYHAPIILTPPPAMPKDPPLRTMRGVTMPRPAKLRRPYRAGDRDRLRLILDAVTKAWDLEDGDLFSPRRYQRIAHPRFAAFRLIRDRFDWSSHQIAEVFRLDHSSIVHGLRISLKLRDQDAEWAKRFAAALAALECPQ